MVAAGFSEREVRFLLDMSRRFATGGAATADRQRRLLTGLCSLVGASTGVSLLFDGEFNIVSEPTVVRRTRSSQDRNNLFRAANSVDDGSIVSSDNPLIQPAIQEALKHYLASINPGSVESTQHQLWHGSRFFRRFLARLGMGDCILSVVSLPRLKPLMAAVCLSGSVTGGRRNGGEPIRFTARQRRAAHVAHGGLRWIYYPEPQMAEQRMSAPVEYACPVRIPATELAPRYQRVLQHLLAGGSEKALADQLNLSRHTIHEYVRAIYKKFNVNSRSELMAYWVEA
jgi:DNA-binding CsgD family transcriptional regulator